MDVDEDHSGGYTVELVTAVEDALRMYKEGNAGVETSSVE